MIGIFESGNSALFKSLVSLPGNPKAEESLFTLPIVEQWKSIPFLLSSGGPYKLFFRIYYHFAMNPLHPQPMFLKWLVSSIPPDPYVTVVNEFADPD
jgi:hypothetical protein